MEIEITKSSETHGRGAEPIDTLEKAPDVSGPIIAPGENDADDPDIGAWFNEGGR